MWHRTSAAFFSIAHMVNLFKATTQASGRSFSRSLSTLGNHVVIIFLCLEVQVVVRAGKTQNPLELRLIRIVKLCLLYPAFVQHLRLRTRPRDTHLNRHCYPLENKGVPNLYKPCQIKLSFKRYKARLCILPG